MSENLENDVTGRAWAAEQRAKTKAEKTVHLSDETIDKLATAVAAALKPADTPGRSKRSSD